MTLLLRVMPAAGAVPQLVTAWQGVSRAECQKAFEQAEAQYNNAFQVGAVAASSEAMRQLSCSRQHCDPRAALTLGCPHTACMPLSTGASAAVTAHHALPQALHMCACLSVRWLAS